MSKGEKEKVDVSALVRLRARESVSLAYAGPVQVNAYARVRSRWTNDLRGQHEPTRLTSDIGAAIGEIQTRLLAAALYIVACARGSIRRPIGQTRDD